MSDGDHQLLDARFRLLVESVQDYAIYLLDPGGTIASWNAGAARIKGWSADEIVGKSFTVFYTQEDRDAGRPQAILRAAREEGRAEDYAWRVRKDGSRFWAHVVVTALKDDSGQLVGYAKITHDLTDRAYRAFVEATNAIVWTTAADGRPNADSPTWRAFTGQTVDDWFGLRAWEPVHPDDQEVLRVGWPRAKQEKRLFEAEFRLRRKDGVYQWMACRAVPLIDPDGNVREWFGVTFDISGRKAAEAEAERAQQWWTTTLMSIGDAVIATDARGVVTLMNPVAEKLTTWKLGEAMGKPLGEVFPIVNEETRHPVASPVQKVLESGAVVGLANHTVLVRRDGTDLPIDDSAAPIRGPDGAIAGVVLVFRDVTEEKVHQARARFLARAGDALASAADYRESLATVAGLAVPRLADWCAIDILDAGATKTEQVAVAHVDPEKVTWARELGHRYPPDPNAATGVYQVIRTGSSELYESIPEELLEAAAKDDEHRRIIKMLQLRSGMVVPLRGRERVFGAMTFIYAESGRHYTQDDLVFAEDLARRAALVIERRKLEEERAQLLEREREARAEAEVANRAKDEFLATVSHELRTPLNAILGWTVTLRRRAIAPEVDRGLAIVERNARAQAKLIEDVLDVSRIISGKMRLDMAAADVTEAVNAAVESLRPAADAKQITLAADVTPELGAIVADPDRLQQIVWNLISNGVKFTQDGGHVTVQARRTDAAVEIVVSDDGPGIPPELRSVIFEPFRQADASTTRRHGGLGLGLAIVRQLVEAHGGTVRVESGDGHPGSRFVVTLPTAAQEPKHAPRVRSSGAEPASRPRLDGLRILVVDDEADAVELMRSVLTDAGAKVMVAYEADTALATVRAERPDVVVSDIGMPGTDGYGLVRKIRMLGAAAGGRTACLAVTAYARATDAERAFSAGFQMHVTKPIEPDRLVLAVASLAGLPLDGGQGGSGEERRTL